MRIFDTADARMEEGESGGVAGRPLTAEDQLREVDDLARQVGQAARAKQDAHNLIAKV